MTAIAVALVIAVLVAAVAYAVPKLYNIKTQKTLIREGNAQEQDRFLALKESHDLSQEPAPGLTISEGTVDKLGQYL